MADQPVNAKQIETLGLGKRLEYKIISSQLLKETVMSVLCDEKIKVNLVNAQNWIAQAPGNKGGAEIIREYYKKEMNNNEEVGLLMAPTSFAVLGLCKELT